MEQCPDLAAVYVVVGGGGLIGGIGSYFQLPQLEDPAFTVKTAVVITLYPGASPQEVELEVTDRIEKAIQELPELKHLYSISRPGLSIIKVDIKNEYWSDRLPQVWDMMRKNIRDIETTLPPPTVERLRILDPVISSSRAFMSPLSNTAECEAPRMMWS